MRFLSFLLPKTTTKIDPQRLDMVTATVRERRLTRNSVHPAHLGRRTVERVSGPTLEERFGK